MTDDGLTDRQREILDPLGEASTLDTVPEHAVELGSADLTQTDRARLRLFRQRSEEIAASGQDPKIEAAEQIIWGMLRQGCHPIVYCRFVATAKYVAAELEKRLKELPKSRQIVAYCRGPYCVFADEAVTLLRNRGYKARRLAQGFPEWKQKGLAVATA